jgi:hypothetical protein
MFPEPVTGFGKAPSGPEAIAPGEGGEDVSRIGWIVFQLATEPRNVGIHCPTAYRSTGSPYFLQQLDARGYGAPSPHQSH